jgi:imidazolonepropionase-like amidohydrolase
MVAVREGMSRVDALRAVTTNPAEICGIDDRVGRLVGGSDADIQVLGGPPFDVMSRVEAVYVSGRLAFERAGALDA